MAADIRVGFSGWTFEAWRGDFYPKGLVQKRELEYASRQVNSIEVNGTFYSLQKPESFQNWASQVPEDFVFAVKAPQYITHVRRLKDCATPLHNFLASGPLSLGARLGPILWQFPPNVTLKDDRFEKFIKLLPHTAKDAAKAAKKHDAKMEGRAWTKVTGDFPVRHAFEFRHPSFNNADFLAFLKAHNVAAVMTHASARAPGFEEATADFVYLRFHGEGKGYAKGYPPAEIKEWAQRFRAWAKQGKPVFAYFGTEAKAYAPFDAVKMMQELSAVPRKRAA